MKRNVQIFRVLPLAAVVLAGCVQVQLAQDKPIDINLNVNIKQEVVVTLKGDAQSLIKNNPNVF
jgi:lipoprotein NlpI